VPVNNNASLETLFRQLGQRGFGTPEWAATFRQILRFYLDPALKASVDTAFGARTNALVIASLERDAEFVRPIMVEAGFSLSEDVESWQQAYSELLDAVQSAFEGNSAMQDIISNIQETVNEVLDRETTETRTETTGTTGTEDTTIGRVETHYVELPTPEKLLDDFDNVMIEYTDTLFRAGDINRTTRDWMMDNPGFFWRDFIAEQYRRIRAGEEVWNVVGVGGPQVRLGSRPGEAVQQELTTLIHQVSTGRLTIEQVVEQTIDRLTEEAGTQGEGVVDTELRQAITEAVNSVYNQFSTETQDTKRAETLRLLTIEEVIARPELDKVFAFSPTDFITGRFTPTELMNIAVAEPGREAAERAAPLGIAPSAPRTLA